MTKTLPRLDLSRPGGLTGWHAGVLAVQQALGFSGSVRSAYEAVDGELPEHHREFHANHLHFLPLTTLDARGRPWVSLLAPSGGRSDAGWVASPTYRELTVACEVAEADPLLVKASETEPFLVAGLGIELETRRRNKFAGEAVAMLDDRHLTMHIRIDEALGNVRLALHY
jgi:predicted pyridoxine 5'-phosphate oxidase superfamily flavin-nucleotide-binding protein